MLCTVGSGRGAHQPDATNAPLPWTKRLRRRWTLDRALLKPRVDPPLRYEDADVALVDLLSNR
jgi:hypothetical protein